jgi:NTE family protein
MICQLRILLAVPLLCLASTSGLTQDAPAARNAPKLGLVLEDDGALGLAHIGVIQWLEEHRIPVSYIACTSMVGVVGGVYATIFGPIEIGGSAGDAGTIASSSAWAGCSKGMTKYGPKPP